MKKNQVLGMFVGCAIGDAFGAPYEFKAPEDIYGIEDTYIAGGTHDVSPGEWTDDTALMMAAADAYITRGRFAPDTIAQNFKAWLTTGKYGTRDYVFDVGGTCKSAIERMNPQIPYAGKATTFSSGNGSIMRIAPALAANHTNVFNAVGESVALSLMTHGNSDTVSHINAFVTEVFGYDADFSSLSAYYDVHTNEHTGSIMHSYNVALKARQYHANDFLGALKYAVSLGYDTDTNAAVTGMLIGSHVGLDNIPKHLIDGLIHSQHIIKTAERLYEMGLTR